MISLATIEEIKCKKPKILKIKPNASNRFFFLHIKCIENFHTHLIEYEVYEATELRCLKQINYFQRNDMFTYNEFNTAENQLYNLKIGFFHLINGKIPFMKLEKEVKQMSRLSLEDDLSVRKNLQVNIYNRAYIYVIFVNYRPILLISIWKRKKKRILILSIHFTILFIIFFQ